jgi:hypothetical protein
LLDIKRFGDISPAGISERIAGFSYKHGSAVEGYGIPPTKRVKGFPYRVVPAAKRYSCT